jgi:hypothetical protein
MSCRNCQKVRAFARNMYWRFARDRALAKIQRRHRAALREQERQQRRQQARRNQL